MSLSEPFHVSVMNSKPGVFKDKFGIRAQN